MPGPGTAPRRVSRGRIFALGGVAVGVVLVLVAVWALFIRDGDGSGDEASDVGPTIVQIVPGEVVNETVGPPATFPEDQRDAIVRKVREYVEAGTVDPLRSGEPATGLGRIFDGGAMTALRGPDGQVMLDQGLPRVTGRLRAASQPVALNALADSTGAWVLVSARLDLDVRGVLDDGTLTIARRGELLFAPDQGDWKVTAFDFVVERKGPGVGGGQGKKGRTQ